MSLPRLLLVDDSEAVLAYGRAALAAHYETVTAANGEEALRVLQDELLPAAVLLDLSMPVMDGDEVLAQMMADARLRAVPVIIVSSETARAHACMRAGARAFLEKPVRAEELRVAVARVLDDEAHKRAAASLAVLVVAAGGRTFALRLDQVVSVHAQVEHCAPGFIDLHGARIRVIDVPACLADAHRAPMLERLLVVVDVAHANTAVAAEPPLHARMERRALCVDAVRDPIVVPESGLVRRGVAHRADRAVAARAVAARAVAARAVAASAAADRAAADRAAADRAVADPAGVDSAVVAVVVEGAGRLAVVDAGAVAMGRLLPSLEAAAA